jgi:hypothetical protein
VDGWGVMCLIVGNPVWVWPRTNYRRDVSSGVVLFVWCSVLVDGWGGACWCLGYYIISYLILYSSFPLSLLIPFSYTLPSSSLPKYLTPHKLSEGCLEWWMVICVVFSVWAGGWFMCWWCVFGVCVIIILYYYTYIILLLYYIILYYIILLYYTYTIIYYTYTILSSDLFFSSPLQFFSSLLFLFPIIPISSFILYLSVLTYTYLYSSWSPTSDPARSIGVDGWGVMCLIVGNPVWRLSWWMLLVFRSDCKVFGCISSKSEDYWCFELV